MKNSEISAILKELSLKSSPIAVKLIDPDTSLENIPAEPAQRYRYCQGLMKAKRGEMLTLMKGTLSCPAAAAAFGFSPLPFKISSGEMLKSLGLFESKEAAANLMKNMPRLQEGIYRAISLAPLEKADYTPHVVVIEDNPEKIMWINLASIHGTGDRLVFNSAIFQACCVDVTVIPFLTGRVNASFGCYGCREATDLRDDEFLGGIPFEKLEGIIMALESLSKKAIPSVRNKGVYKQFESSSETR